MKKDTNKPSTTPAEKAAQPPGEAKEQAGSAPAEFCFRDPKRKLRVCLTFEPDESECGTDDDEP